LANGQADAEAFPFGANASAQGTTPAEGAPAAEAAALDPFDPARLRLPQDHAVASGVKKALTTVRVRKPDKSWFVRAHPDPQYRLQTYVLELKEDREVYLVAPALWQKLAAEPTFKPKLFVTAINRQGDLFLWDISLPRSDGKRDDWSRSSLDAAERATKRWVRVVANMSNGAYDLYEASAQLSEPEWPDTPFKEILRLGFRDYYIGSLDHPKVRQLRGEV
jgi:hypothetical protein